MELGLVCVLEGLEAGESDAKTLRASGWSLLFEIFGPWIELSAGAQTEID
jgi:hypothetical protein